MSEELSEHAPEFRLQNQNGEWVELKDLLARGPLMLVFYPGDFTPVCTRQLCSYQEAYDDFGKYGLQIVGISPNSPESHRNFRERYRFSFDLLSDPGKTVTKAYHLTSLFLLGGTSRAVLFIGRDAKIIYRYVEPTPLTHRKPGELLEIAGELSRSGKLK